jgi:glycolate oxidase FAD binding subunit
MPADAPPATFAVDGLTPSSVIEPSSIDELSAAICDANERGTAVIPWGAGCHMSLGNVPERYDVALRTTKLDRVIEYEPADMTVTVEAGITFGVLQSLVAEHGQFLPIDAPREATVGGVLAANVSGPSRHAYGLPRDWLIGCRLVLADGTIIKGGGRVVKNVAGYDIPKLAVGSLGTLGVSVEATFKLAPLPPAQEKITVQCESAALAAQLVFAADERSLALRGVAISGPRPGEASPWSATFWLAGTPAAVERTRREVEALGMTERDGDAWWEQARVNNAVEAQASVLPSGVVGFCEHVIPYPADIVAYPTTGLVNVMLSEAEPDETARRVHEARRHAADAGGSLLVTSAPVEVKRRIDVWGEVDGFDVMRELKRQFDPKSTLNPGRFVGGI